MSSPTVIRPSADFSFLFFYLSQSLKCKPVLETFQTGLIKWSFLYKVFWLAEIEYYKVIPSLLQGTGRINDCFACERFGGATLHGWKCTLINEAPIKSLTNTDEQLDAHHTDTLSCASRVIVEQLCLNPFQHSCFLVLPEANGWCSAAWQGPIPEGWSWISELMGVAGVPVHKMGWSH